jgi:hypothetical protein
MQADPLQGLYNGIAGGFAGALAVLLKDEVTRWIMRPRLFAETLEAHENGYRHKFYLVVGNRGATTATVCMGQLSLLPVPRDDDGGEPIVARAIEEGVFTGHRRGDFVDIPALWRGQEISGPVSIHPSQRQRLLVAEADTDLRWFKEPRAVLEARSSDKTVPWDHFEFTVRVGSDTARTLTVTGTVGWREAALPWPFCNPTMEITRSFGDAWWPWCGWLRERWHLAAPHIQLAKTALLRLRGRIYRRWAPADGQGDTPTDGSEAS